MRGVMSIARSELVRRWPLVVVGFVIGLVPQFFQPIYHPSKLADTLLVLGIVASWTISFAAGMSLVGKPLHDGRLSFYFTRPIAAPAIAFGKVLGGCLAITGMQLALALPLLRGEETLIETGNTTRLALGLAFVGNAFMAAGLVVGILARSRARWFIVDALAGTIAAIASVGFFAALGTRKADAARTMDYGDALNLIDRTNTLLWSVTELAAVILFGSVIIAIAIGRTDRERVHRTLSFTLWPALTVLALGGLAFARWGIQ